MEESNFCSLIIDADILARSELTAQEKIVLSQVHQFGKRGQHCTFSNATFGKILSVSPDRAGRVIASLIRKNVLAVIEEKFDGRHRVLVEQGSQLLNSSIAENNDSASSNPTNSSEPTDSCSGENTEAEPQCPDENTNSASTDSTMQRGSVGESAEKILNNIATKIKKIFKCKFFSDSEYQRFEWYVLKKKQTPSKEPLDTEERLLNFAEEWYPDSKSTWLPEVDGEYRRPIFNILAKEYANYPEKLIRITHIQRNTAINTIEITISGAEAWFNSKMLEMAKILHNFSSDSRCPKIIIKTQNK